MEIAAKSSVLLADWIAGFDADNCSVHDLNAVRLRILDYISSAAAGWTCNRTYNEAVDVLFCADGCDARSSVLFNGKSCRLPQPPMSMQRMDTVRIWMTDIGRRTDTPA